MKTRHNSQFLELPIETADGRFVAHYSEKGLAGLEFPRDAKERRAELEPCEVPEHIRPWHDAAKQALLQALAGQEPKALPRLDMSGGTEFQQRVWNALRQIGPGKTRSYAEIAEAIGNPKAVRAVGGACGANPIPVLVPCHRVLAAHRKLGGFSGGLHWKRALLEREAVKMDD
jgi:O-6-methylguanine DNA methyltransferase